MPIEPGSGASGLSRVYIEGDLLFDDMLRDIECAQRSVRFESYIFTSDPVGRQFVDTLARCATRGLDVRLRVDHLGSWRDLSNADIERLRAGGVHFEWSRRWSVRRPLAINRRNHRKLLVVGEACNAGVLEPGLVGPGALLVAAGSPTENSFWANWVVAGGLWRADQFSWELYQTLSADPTRSITALYESLYLNVPGSHVTVYNAERFGNPRLIPAADFITP